MRAARLRRTDKGPVHSAPYRAKVEINPQSAGPRRKKSGPPALPRRKVRQPRGCNDEAAGNHGTYAPAGKKIRQTLSYPDTFNYLCVLKVFT